MKLTDEELFDLTTWTPFGIKPFMVCKRNNWDDVTTFEVNRNTQTKWKIDNTLHNIFTKLAKKSENKA